MTGIYTAMFMGYESFKGFFVLEKSKTNTRVFEGNWEILIEFLLVLGNFIKYGWILLDF